MPILHVRELDERCEHLPNGYTEPVYTAWSTHARRNEDALRSLIRHCRFRCHPKAACSSFLAATMISISRHPHDGDLHVSPRTRAFYMPVLALAIDVSSSQPFQDALPDSSVPLSIPRPCPLQTIFTMDGRDKFKPQLCWRQLVLSACLPGVSQCCSVINQDSQMTDQTG